MPRQRPVLVIILWIACGAVISGCAAMSDLGSRDGADSLTQSPATSTSRGVALASYEQAAEEDAGEKSLKIDDFAPSNIGATVKQLAGYGPNRDVARQLYSEAEELYGQAVGLRGDQPQAEPNAKAAPVVSRGQRQICRGRGSLARFGDGRRRSVSRGESQFFADRYVKANEFFEQLLKKYPNSRYLDAVGARRFLIAQYWLNLNTEEPTYPFGVNLTDKGRPWSDTFGHAIRVYDRMRIDDPTGKLADDATIAAANAFFLKGDFGKADQYYTDLRTHFPSSEHQFMAHYLGVQAKLRGYRGPQYTGDALEQADKLVLQIRRQFPKEAREHQQELDRAYREIRYLLAEREWTMAQYYERQHEFGAARFYYDVILNKFSDTPFADKARTEIGRYRRETAHAAAAPFLAR